MHCFTPRHSQLAGPSHRVWAFLLVLALTVFGPVNAADDIPSRPEEISFGELRFEPPERGKFRHELPKPPQCIAARGAAIIVYNMW